MTLTFDLLQPSYCDMVGICFNMCRPGLVKICQIVLEVSRLKGFSWPISVPCCLDLWHTDRLFPPRTTCASLRQNQFFNLHNVVFTVLLMDEQANEWTGRKTVVSLVSLNWRRRNNWCFVPCCRVMLLGEFAPARITVPQNSSFPVRSTAALLQHLHWLPVDSRISFRLSTITFKALGSDRPSHLAVFLHNYSPSRTMRSSSAKLLTVPRHNVLLVSRAFCISAATTWNLLPQKLTCAWILTWF